MIRLACMLIVTVSVVLSLVAATAVGLALQEDRGYYRSALPIGMLVPMLVASPVSWVVVNLPHEVEAAHAQALNLA